MGKRGGEEEREEKEKKKKRESKIIYIYIFYNFETIIKCQSQRCLVYGLKQQFSIFLKIRVSKKIYKNTCNVI